MILEILNNLNTTGSLEMFIVQGITSILFIIIGFFLVRYIKSVDKKLEYIIRDINFLSSENKLSKKSLEYSEQEHTYIKTIIDKINEKIEIIEKNYIILNEKINEIIKKVEKLEV